VKASTVLLALVVVASRATAQKPPLTLERYVKSDGAITVFADGSYVEPYFAMRALNTAADLGGNVDSLARGYIDWQLRRLAVDSSFRRYCLGADSTWTSCGPADADDAALALWIELLYRMAGRHRLPAEWKRSADVSRRALGTLLDSTAKVYFVSQSIRTALFMDNVEVLSALDVASRTTAARLAADRLPLRRGAARLQSAITRAFWDTGTRAYRVSSQARAPEQRFYPEIVAQIFPAIFGFGNPRASTQALATQWLREHEGEWIAESDSSAAWGLVAVAAARAGQAQAVDRWLERADRVRAGAHWNVADEAIYRVLSALPVHQRIR
jgi:hypothetical protein